ncbi:hypothetical protein [Vibrio splendidus]|uniref:hypothetical protein n=1 Tax=Vibrio splendidus TaxID=29497 RepID=UPI001FB24521|nr:hypothetical protein [Vibrio splendidus]UOE85780.1 hypothetical protein LTQ54_07275 [Vibrio splendidus]
MSSYLGLLLLFIAIFAGWVVFVIIDGLNSAFWLSLKAKEFRKRVISLLENPIEHQSNGATWRNVKAIATEYHLSRNFVLYTLENMLSKATSAYDETGKELRPYIQDLEKIIEDCETAKDFEMLPKSIQINLKAIKSDHPNDKTSIFLLLEQDILKLKTSVEGTFSWERKKSFISLIFGLISLIIGVGPSIINYMGW